MPPFLRDDFSGGIGYVGVITSKLCHAAISTNVSVISSDKTRNLGILITTITDRLYRFMDSSQSSMLRYEVSGTILFHDVGSIKVRVRICQYIQLRRSHSYSQKSGHFTVRHLAHRKVRRFNFTILAHTMS